MLSTSAREGWAELGAAWEGPGAPGRSLRRRRWNEADLAALSLCAGSVEGSLGRVSFALVPICSGGIELGRVHEARDASCEEARDALNRSLDRRYLVMWSVEREASCLEDVLGWQTTGWVRRTIDISRLACVIEGRALNGESQDELAVRYGVPGPASTEPVEEALVAAQLFLVMATKLAARGERTIAELLRRTRPGAR